MQQRMFYVLELLALLLLGCSVGSSGHRRKVGKGENDVIDEILSSNNDMQSIIDKLSELKGQWPFNDKGECDTMNTLDRGYHRYEHRGSHELVRNLLERVPRCGMAATTTRVHSESDHSKSNVDSSSRHLSRDNELEEPEAINRVLEESIVLMGNTDMEEDSAPSHVVEKHSTRVVGGRLTQPGAWPWLAAIGRKASGPKCGGTLISDRWVLTAAHCFEDKEMPCTYNVRLGSRSWLYDDEGTHVDSTVTAIYRHPDYDGDTHVNDIALLKLDNVIDLNENSHINAVCLPSRSRSVDPGTVCVAAGWGKTAESDKAAVYDSREVEIPVVGYSDSKCGKYEDGTVGMGMVCAGYRKGGRDTCQGDSGGPLMYQREDQRWTQLGVTSFGEGCARAYYPGVYTDVGYHLQWIASVMDRY